MRTAKTLIRLSRCRGWSESAHNHCVGFVMRRLIYSLSLQMGRVKRIWYLSPMRAAKVQASLRICAVSPEPLLLAHTSSESRGTFRQKIRSLAPPNGWACAVKICHDGMLEDTNLLDAPQMIVVHIACDAILYSQYNFRLTTTGFIFGMEGSQNTHICNQPCVLKSLKSCKFLLIDHL